MRAYGKVTGIVAAIAALAVSDIALAEHDPDHVPSKEKPKGAPGQVKSKFSIEVENHCKFDDETNVLTVHSTIWNESEEPVTITDVHVDGFQLLIENDDSTNNKKKTKIWKSVGRAVYPDDPAVPFQIASDPGGEYPQSYDVLMNLCQNVPLDTDAKALNVTTQFMINDRNFYGNCDNVDSDEDGDLLNDGDESRIDLDDPDYDVVECPPGQP
jgi:hypothetical protein